MNSRISNVRTYVCVQNIAFVMARWPGLSSHLDVNYFRFQFILHYLHQTVSQILAIMGPFYWHGLTYIPAWVSNYIYYKVHDWFIHTPNSTAVPLSFGNGKQLYPHFIMDVITYPSSWSQHTRESSDSNNCVNATSDDIKNHNKLWWLRMGGKYNCTVFVHCWWS